MALKPLEIIADGRFDLFWEAYPRKVDRKKCLRMFDKLMRTVDHEDIMDGLGRWILYWQRRGDPEFIPHPYTWLYNERWTEQPPSNGEKRSAVGNKMREMYAEAIEAEGR